MGRSVAVLDWTDIQILVRLSAQSVPPKSAHFADLEAVRHEFVDALQIYLQEWFPGAEIDDETRKPLVRSIESFAANYKTPIPGALAPEEVQEQCGRIAKLLRAAIERNVKKPSSGGPLSMLFLLSLAAQAGAL